MVVLGRRVPTWGDVPSAVRDAAWIILAMALVWLAIERTETCDRFFDWVAENPDYEMDSAILAFILASAGTAIYAVRRYNEARHAVAHQRLAEERAQSLAYHDPLTGLPNRRALNERLEGLADRTLLGGGTALLIVDLDRFKAVNDVHGHLAGDRLLRLVARRFLETLGEGPDLYRLGGDEFAVVCAVPKGGHELPQHLARRIVHALAEPFHDGDLALHIGASAGIAMFPGDAADRETLLRRADIALYRAKQGGRGQHRSFEATMDAEITRRARIEDELRAAVRADELRPFFQPLVDLASGRTIGFEMLARWPRPGREPIGPDVFIAIAEEGGLITELMLRLLRRTCEEAGGWDPALSVAVNVSPVQLRDPLLTEKMLAVLAETGFAPTRLHVEITETALIGDADAARRAVEAFKRHGIQVGLDDFGTGYSSLHHLRMLPFDTIKIDRSFILALEHDEEAFKIVRAIINLAVSLGLPVVAEGIESEAIARQLGEIGCTQGQGYYFGRPVPGDAIVHDARAA